MEPNKNNSGTNALFGQTSGAFSNFSFSSSSTTPQSSPAKASIFGATPSATPGGSLFGSISNNKTGPAAQNTLTGNTVPSSPSKAPIFGGAVNNSSAATTSGNLFNAFGNISGNTSTAGSSPSINANANQANAVPQTSNLFGSKAPANTNNIFSSTSAITNSNTGPSASNPPTNSASTPTPTFSFGTPSNITPAKDAAAGQPSIFGGGANSETSSKTATNTAASTNIFATKPTDSSTLNKAPGSAGPVATATTIASNSSSSPFNPSLPSKPTGSLFGAATGNSNNTGLFSAKSSTAPAKSSPLATNSTTNSSGGGESNSQNTSTAGNNSSPTAGTTPATFSSSTSNTTTTNSNSNKPNINLAPSLLKGKTLEDLVSRWNSELDERVEDFKLTANEIAAWDRALIQNGDQISALYEELQRIDPIQSSIDQTLDYVETQQSELSAALEDYERQLANQQAGGVADMTMMTGGNGRMRTAGQEREEAYKTAEEVHAQLNDMAGSLGTMIAELNSLAGPANRIDESSIADGSNFGSSYNTSMEDPIVQISGILNAHLGSLNWISEITNELGSKIVELESRVSNTKLEFGLESNSNHPNKQSVDLDDLSHLSLSKNYTNNHSTNGTGLQGFGGMRNLSNSVLSHPRR